jgi:hypothetical protein
VALRLYLLHPAKTEVSIIEGVLLKASLLGGARPWKMLENQKLNHIYLLVI